MYCGFWEERHPMYHMKKGRGCRATFFSFPPFLFLLFFSLSSLVVSDTSALFLHIVL